MEDRGVDLKATQVESIQHGSRCSRTPTDHPVRGTGPGDPARGRGAHPAELVPRRRAGRFCGQELLHGGAGGGPAAPLLGVRKLHTFPCPPRSVTPSPLHTLFVKGVLSPSSMVCAIGAHSSQLRGGEGGRGWGGWEKKPA